MLKFTKCLVGILNMVSRVIIFFFFWWAFDDTGGPFKDTTLAFQNEFDVWQSRPFDGIQQYFDKDSCPLGSIHIGTYFWPGMNQYNNNGIEHVGIEGREFTKWTTSSLGNKPFIICGIESKQNFIDTANSSNRCADRKLMECSGGKYCTSSDRCPITSITLDEKTGGITSFYDPALSPISRFRIDAKFVCLNKNVTNLFDGQKVDPNLKQQQNFQNCNEEDTEYIRLNTIDDLLYFQINNADKYQTLNATYNKTLFYKRYSDFNSSCYGDLFNEVISIRNNVIKMIDLSDVGYLASVAYLLLICYIFPGLPMVFRCFAPCQVENLIGWDYLIRIILTLINVAFSVEVLLFNLKILVSIDLVKNSGCFQDQGKMDQVVVIAEDNVFLHILALIITTGLLLVELSVWLIIFCSACLSKCYFFIKKQQEPKENIEQDQELQALQK